MRSYPPKNILLGSPMFFLVNPDDLNGLNEWTEYLDSILHVPCRIEDLPDGLHLIEERQRVVQVRGLKIEIFGCEHPPPHFHVKSRDINVSFAIDDCRLINGIPPSGKVLRAIQYWHRNARPCLIEVWNATRPNGCSVGAFRDNT